jgi:hypothetical protein
MAYEMSSIEFHEVRAGPQASFGTQSAHKSAHKLAQMLYIGSELRPSHVTASPQALRKPGLTTAGRNRKYV